MPFGDELIKARSFLTFDADFIDPEQPTGLWFCGSVEEVQAVGVNAVKLADGADWKDLRRCEGFFKAFPYVFIPVSESHTREQIIGHLQAVLPGLTLYIPSANAFRGCRTVAEFREQFGLGKVNELLLDARELPGYGLLNMADITPMDYKRLPRFRSGIPELDRFTGGFYGGQLSLWTGERGLGKSTLLGQLLLESIDQGATVCAYSGELDKRQFKQWCSIQAAGPSHVGVFEDRETGRKMAALAGSVQKRIDEWWDKKFFLYDVGTASSHSEDSILTTFENARRCYGASVFLVDNIMTISLQRSREGDYFRAQSNFTGRLVQFAKQHSVHVHLVAHPKKSDSDRKRLRSDDIAGTGDLPNRADNVFALEKDTVSVRDKAVDVTVIHCLKNRMYGGEKRIAMQFDIKSKRFYRPSSEPDKVYGWEKDLPQMEIYEIADTGDDPFAEGGEKA